MSQISAVIITFNEEKHIEKCLASLTGIVDEIIVVDSFSTDTTKEICSKFNVVFIEQNFLGYLEQKNHAVSLAKYDHILSLDGDEALSDELKKVILDIKQNWIFDAYYVNRRNNYCGKWIKHSGWYPDKKIRLFKKDAGAWGGINPHDTFIPFSSKKVGHIKADLLHWVHENYSEHNQKVEIFSSISAESYYNFGKKSTILKIFYRPLWAFFKAYILQLGFLDGLNGWIISVQRYNLTFLKYIKLYQIQKSKSD